MLFSWVIAAQSASAADRFAQVEAEVRRYQEQGKIHEIRNLLQPLVRSGNINVCLLIQYADSFLDDADFDDKGSAEAEKALKLCIKMEPSYGDAYRDMAKLNVINGDYPAAVKYATQALSCKPPSPTAFRLRAVANERLHKYSEALADINACIKSEPRQSHNYMVKAAILENLGRWDEAVATYHELLKSDNKEVPYFLIARCYKNAKKLPQAIATLSEVVKRNPLDPEAFEARAKILIEQNKFPEALRDFNESIRLDSNSRVYKERAQLYELMGRKSDAAKDRASAEKQIGGF